MMSENNVIYDSCRVCLIYKGTIPLTDKRNKVQINDMIMEFSDLNLCVINNNDLPKKVCHQCVQSLENAVKLKISIRDSDLMLREMFNYDLENISDTGDCLSIKLEEKSYDNILNVDVKIENFTNENSISSNDEQNLDTEIIKTGPAKLRGRKPRNFICNECKEGFTSDKKLQQHLMVHLGPRPYKCDLCPKDFIRKSYLTVHKKKHKSEKTFICEYCSKAFLFQYDLNTHIKIHLPDSEKKIECKDCGRKFHTKRVLKMHSVIHTNIKRFVCNECGHAFYKKVALESHMDGVHLRIKRYACSYCNQLYSSSGSLKRHKRIHTGEKPYECEYCDARFNQSTLRVKHRKKHVERGDTPKISVLKNLAEDLKTD